MPTMCQFFIDISIDEICHGKFYHEFLLHLCSLRHTDLIRQKILIVVIEHLHEHMNDQPMLKQKKQY